MPALGVAWHYLRDNPETLVYNREEQKTFVPEEAPCACCGNGVSALHEQQTLTSTTEGQRRHAAQQREAAGQARRGAERVRQTEETDCQTAEDQRTLMEARRGAGEELRATGEQLREANGTAALNCGAVTAHAGRRDVAV